MGEFIAAIICIAVLLGVGFLVFSVIPAAILFKSLLIGIMLAGGLAIFCVIIGALGDDNGKPGHTY